jgi:hypothetical protein
LRDHPEALRTERGYIIRSGDLGKIWLFNVGTFLRGEAKGLSAFEFNSWFFTLGLVAILVAAWYIDRLLLGMLIVLLVGSHPFQLFEVYADQVPGTVCSTGHLPLSTCTSCRSRPGFSLGQFDK